MRTIANRIRAGMALVSLPLALSFTGCVDATDMAQPEPAAVGEASATLVGTVLDTLEQPVADATVVLAINGYDVGEAVLTDAEGRYALQVQVSAITEAQRLRQEIQVLVRPPLADLGARGTWAGDHIQELPLTLREFVPMEHLVPGRKLAMKTGFVPVQGKGFPITDALKRDGGTLTWHMARSPVGPIDVSLIVEPGSIRVESDDPQDEITLTILDREKVPMAIPDDGYGLMWTIQPRGVIFDPPAKVSISGGRLELLGLVEAEPGNTFELYGASLDRGWRLYGDVAVEALTDDQVTLTSVEGIIQRGAWGHVLSNPASDAGMLATCRNKHTGRYVVCAIFGQAGFDLAGPPLSLFETQVSPRQADYRRQPNRPYWYTDRENRCQNCTNIGVPQAQMAVGLSVGLPEDDGNQGVFVVATELCASEAIVRNLDERDTLVSNRVANWALQFGVEEIDIGAGEGQTPRTELWESFCNDEDVCPDFEPGEVTVQRRQFTRRHIFETSSFHCAADDRQEGWVGR